MAMIMAVPEDHTSLSGLKIIKGGSIPSTRTMSLWVPCKAMLAVLLLCTQCSAAHDANCIAQDADCTISHGANAEDASILLQLQEKDSSRTLKQAKIQEEGTDESESEEEDIDESESEEEDTDESESETSANKCTYQLETKPHPSFKSFTLYRVEVTAGTVLKVFDFQKTKSIKKAQKVCQNFCTQSSECVGYQIDGNSKISMSSGKINGKAKNAIRCMAFSNIQDTFYHEGWSYVKTKTQSNKCPVTAGNEPPVQNLAWKRQSYSSGEISWTNAGRQCTWEVEMQGVCTLDTGCVQVSHFSDTTYRITGLTATEISRFLVRDRCSNTDPWKYLGGRSTAYQSKTADYSDAVNLLVDVMGPGAPKQDGAYGGHVYIPGSAVGKKKGTELVFMLVFVPGTDEYDSNTGLGMFPQGVNRVSLNALEVKLHFRDDVFKMIGSTTTFNPTSSQSWVNYNGWPSGMYQATNWDGNRSMVYSAMINWGELNRNSKYATSGVVVHEYPAELLSPYDCGEEEKGLMWFEVVEWMQEPRAHDGDQRPGDVQFNVQDQAYTDTCDDNTGNTYQRCGAGVDPPCFAMKVCKMNNNGKRKCYRSF